MWQVKRNLTRAVHGIISWWHGGEKKEKARAHIKPDGALTAWLNKLFHVRVGSDDGTATELEMTDGGQVNIHGNTGIRITWGPGSSGRVTVPTPSFQPHSTPPPELYQYDGNQTFKGPALADITIDSSGTITIDAAPGQNVEINGGMQVNVTGPQLVTVTAAAVNINGMTTINGNTTINGILSVNGMVIVNGEVVHG